MNESHYNPLVSVVIPGYKDEFILETIASVENQTYKNIEIIVVDDGSPNNLEEKLKELIKENRIKYFYQENQKMAAARNNGISKASGELIAFIDDDDLWLPEKLEKQVPHFSDPEIGLVYCFAEGFRENEKVPIPNFEIAHRGKIFTHLFMEDFICNSSVMIRKSCLDKTGVFNASPEYYGVDDVDLWTRITYYYQAEVIPEILAKLRLHSSRFSSNSDLMQQHDINARKQLINDLDVPKEIIRRYFQRIFFEMGFSKRRHNKKEALRCYIKSLQSNLSVKTLLAVIKLPFN